MTATEIILRVAFLIGGYLFGLIETGMIYGKLKGVDIRKHGSGNLGMTNALRVLGPKAGLVVFIGDLFKAFIPCLIVNLSTRAFYPDTYLIFVMYMGLGVVLGHNFPFYMNFKGGKGISSSAGAIIGLLNPWMCLILIATFFIVLIITKYVSVSSIALMTAYFIVFTVFALNGWLCFNPDDPVSHGVMVEGIIVAGVFAVLAIARHHENIGRLLRHEENKFSLHKSGDAKNKVEEK